ncbi:MAG TPA: CPBP family intramembrane glutamic endopeptidase [Steroidobacter sp.]|uniref:CPBP family intramembrane glutamic endopeptidase n=1 Tax=Steroidobacter sp. TaxID=1978227 RepID=UPI002ED7D38A
MRAFALFVALLAGSLLVAAVLTYPAWWLVSLVSIEPVHRVMHRIAMLLALIGLVVLTRRLGLSNKEALGYGLPRRDFLRQIGIGFVCGVGLMFPLTALLLGLDIREVKPGFDGAWLGLIAGGLLTGVTVAFIEETFFRGVLFTAVSRTSGAAAAVIAPSLLYASLHFLGGKLRVPPEDVSWVHGFEVLSKLFERYVQPLTFADSFVALAMLGVLFALVRLRTGAIAGCIGLHAAGVAFIAVLRAATRVNPEAEYAVLVGSYDGVIGWAALVWFTVIAAAFVLFTNKLSASPRGS